MPHEHERQAEQQRRLLERPGQGARGQSASTGSAFAGGNSGTHGDAVTRASEDGETLEEWLMGDPWSDRFYFKAWTPIYKKPQG